MTRTVTMTIDENGDAIFLKGHGGDAFLALGDVRTRRASHVEPNSWLLRVLFHAIRRNCTDSCKRAAFTRMWPCLWRINTAPVGGPILCTLYRDRKQAIEAEVVFLTKFFFTGEKI
jgi:hypothetical protein